ncbi:hypothetical protein PFISCL1PPCAC_23874, partial [Pristionchus fissidentatus]
SPPFQMGFLPLFIVALAASAARAADPCACVKPVQTIDSIHDPMLFFQQPTEGGILNGVTCSMNCDFVANLDKGSDTFSLQVELLTNNLGPGGKLTIDGMNDTVSIYPSTAPGTVNARSTGDSITISFTEPSTELGEFMIVVRKQPGRPDPVVIKTTTAAPTFAPFDPNFKHNPLLVANDIMLAFDMSSDRIDDYKTFATALIQQLTINPKPMDPTEKEVCGSGSRLTVIGLSSLSGFSNIYAPYWTTSSEQAVGNINSLFKVSSGDFYINPVEDLYIKGFGKSADNSTTNCENRGKIFILLTSNSPAEYKPGQINNHIDFLENGVHQILVNVDMKEAATTYYDEYKNDGTDARNVWSIFNLGVDKDIENFLNNYLVDSKSPMTCQLSDKESSVAIGAGDPVIVNIPPYYDAKATAGLGDWTTIKHYCNFQDTTVKLTRGVIGKQKVCLTVFYDLETGKDFVSIFSGEGDDQVEVVRLTGRDVSGTQFELPDAAGSIVFSSDEKNVYDGFHAEISPC